MTRLITALCLSSSFLAGTTYAQTAADQITFDDSGTVVLQGANVQEALESTDAALASADAAIDAVASDVDDFHTGVAADASMVALRGDCTGIENCFTSMSAVTDWLWTGASPRNPTAGDPLVVNIGPGEFGPISCVNAGHVSFRGSSREHTVIASGDSIPAVDANGCTGLTFQDLLVRAWEIGFLWQGLGEATLTDVDIVVGGSPTRTFAWWDLGIGCTPTRPEVYWWGVRVLQEATGNHPAWGNLGIYNQCAQNWLYGSEITVIGSANTPSQSQLTAVYVLGGDTRLFGSVVRAQVGDAVDTEWTPIGGLVPGFGGIWVGPNSALHMHGGIVNADASASNEPVHAVALAADRFPSSPALLVHTPGTAFVVTGGLEGSATRVRQSNIEIQSPFQWPAGANAPSIASVNGLDTFVETDCSSTGDCAGGGTGTHLMIYNDACLIDGPWFNVVTRECRGVISP